MYRRGSQAVFFVLYALFVFFSGCATAPVTTPAPPAPPAVTEAPGAHDLGVTAFERGDYVKALFSFKESLAAGREAGDREAEESDLLDIGKTLTGLSRYNEAVSYLNDAMKLSFALKDEARLAGVYAALARADFMAGRVAPAKENIEAALSIDRRLGTVPGERLNLSGLIYLESGRPRDAARVLKEALAVNGRSGDRAALAGSYRALARLNLMEKRRGEAMGFFKKAYELDRTVGDGRRAASDLSEMAGIYMLEGRFNEAVTLFKRAYLVNIKGGRTMDALKDLDKLVKAYKFMGDDVNALYYTTMRDGILSDINKRTERPR